MKYLYFLFSFRKAANEHGEYFSSVKKHIEETYITNNNVQVLSFPKNLYILCRLFLKHFYCKYEDEEETSNFLKFANLQFLFLDIWRQMIIDY